MASVLCCAGICSLLLIPVSRARAVYEAVTFLPTYTVGILAWFLHGITIGSPALIVPCGIQLAVLPVLIRRSVRLHHMETPHGL
jgi:hypothetical protein